MKFHISNIFAFLMVCFFTVSGTAYAQTSQNKPAQTPDVQKTATITVSGLTCDGDLKMIKDKLVKQEGIDQALFSKRQNGQSTFQVDYHTSVLTEAQLKSLVETTPSCDHPGKYPYKVKKVASATAKNTEL